MAKLITKPTECGYHSDMHEICYHEDRANSDNKYCPCLVFPDNCPLLEITERVINICKLTKKVKSILTTKDLQDIDRAMEEQIPDTCCDIYNDKHNCAYFDEAQGRNFCINTDRGVNKCTGPNCGYYESKKS